MGGRDLASLALSRRRRSVVWGRGVPPARLLLRIVCRRSVALQPAPICTSADSRVCPFPVGLPCGAAFAALCAGPYYWIARHAPTVDATSLSGRQPTLHHFVAFLRHGQGERRTRGDASGMDGKEPTARQGYAIDYALQLDGAEARLPGRCCQAAAHFGRAGVLQPARRECRTGRRSYRNGSAVESPCVGFAFPLEPATGRRKRHRRGPELPCRRDPAGALLVSVSPAGDLLRHAASA